MIDVLQDSPQTETEDSYARQRKGEEEHTLGVLLPVEEIGETLFNA